MTNGIRFSDGSSIDFLSTDWKIEVDEEDESVRFISKTDGETVELHNDGTVKTTGRALASDISVGDSWALVESEDNLHVENTETGESFDFTSDGSVEFSGSYNFGANPTFDGLSIGELSVTNSITDPSGNTISELSAISIGAADLIQLNEFVTEVAEAQFELGLQRLDFRSGTYDVFVDESYDQTINGEVSDGEASIVDGETVAEFHYTDEEVSFDVTEAVLTVTGSLVEDVSVELHSDTDDVAVVAEIDEIVDVDLDGDLQEIQLHLERESDTDSSPTVQDFAIYLTE